jgi:DNA polymerase-1
MKIAMVRAHKMIPKEARLLLTVHDELVTMTPEHLTDVTVKAIRDAMEDIHMLKIPLIADITVVDRWGEAK